MAKRKNKRSSERLSAPEIVAIIDAVSKVFVTFITVGGYVWIAYFIGRAIEPLAGEFTSAKFDISANMSTNGSIFCPTSYVIVGMMIVTFLGLRTAGRERRLRHINTEELSSRIQFLETQLDPGRTSSKLTSYGETREEDK